MARIVVSTSSFARYDSGPLQLLEAAGYEVVLNPHGRRLEPEETLELLQAARGLIAGTEALGQETLAACPELAVISRCGVGMDGVDLDAASELGIRVLGTTDAHVDPVAELALSGVLSLLRRLGEAERSLRGGGWRKPMGRLLRGKTVGIVGLGRTGRRLVELLAPFSCEILAVDPAPDPPFAAAHGVTYGALETVLAKADIVTLHLDYSPAVHHLIAAPQLALMNDAAILINTARGGLVDEEALAAALQENRLGGAFIDVFEREPYSGPLIGMDNVLLSPHIGSYAVEGRIAMETEAAQNLLTALAERS